MGIFQLGLQGHHLLLILVNLILEHFKTDRSIDKMWQMEDLYKMQAQNHTSLQMTGIGQKAPIDYEEYEVQPGDTIMSVAFKKKINQRLLRKVNNFLIEDLVVGETIMIPIMPEEDKSYVERRFSQFTIKMNT